MGRILVIRGGAIGDFVLTLPVLEALRSRFPQASLEVLGYPATARLACAGGLADAAHAIESRPLAGFFARHGELDGRMASFFAGFDVIISFLYDPDGIFRENVGRCTRGQFIVGPHRPDESGPLHAVESFLKPLERLAIFETEAAPRLDVSAVSPGPGRWIAAHPGSGSESKNWPEARWAELLQRVLRLTSHRLLLIGGEAEGDRLERLLRDLPADRVRVARSLALDQLATLLGGCEQFVGHDSGITHLAAAVGLRCLVLWGPSNPVIWRPRGSRVLTVQDDRGLTALSCDSVWEILRQQLEPSFP